MFHAANAYYAPIVAIRTRRLRTDIASNTAFRGFGGPQGMLAIERVMDAIAHETGRDPLDVRKANLLRPGADLTPYGMHVTETDTLPALPIMGSITTQAKVSPCMAKRFSKASKSL